jgi:PhzF family phenazine biosynthesis protein
MALPLQVVDAFTATPFHGNPAAIVLCDGGHDTSRDDPWMQAVAAEMKHAETAFLEPDGNGAFGLRWFTPVAEVDLCGHATLAGAHALWDWGVLGLEDAATFQTRSGVLTCRSVGDRIEMDFPATPAAPSAAPAGLFEALGTAPTDAFRSDFYVLVELADATAVRKLAPDMARLLDVDARGVIVTAIDSEYDVVSRMFAPRMGIPEDPVTGSAHCVLAPHYASRLGPQLRAFQASERGGVVHTRLDRDRVTLGGQAVTVLRGELVA